MTTMNNLYYACHEAAHLYAATKRDDPEIQVFTRYDDGLDIPAGTRVRVIVVLEHMPDREITPELVMEEAIA